MTDSSRSKQPTNSFAAGVYIHLAWLMAQINTLGLIKIEAETEKFNYINAMVFLFRNNLDSHRVHYCWKHLLSTTYIPEYLYSLYFKN